MSNTHQSKKQNYRILDEFCEKPLIRIGITVRDFEDSLLFYKESLGCRILSKQNESVEIDFFGYNVVLHRQINESQKDDSSSPNLEYIESYFGLVVGWEDWHRAVSHLTYVGTSFRIRPKVEINKFGKEEAAFVLEDPSGNYLKFAAYRLVDSAQKSF